MIESAARTRWESPLDASGNVFFATQNLAFAANGSEGIRRIDAITGKISTYVNSTGIGDNNSQTLSGAQIGDGGAASNAMLTSPMGVTFDSHGNLYIGDAYDRRVRMVAH